ncbi:MAG: RagB/SusD family nutrient uptake outer membrane protein [Sediminibacterium sp.]
MKHTIYSLLTLLVLVTGCTKKFLDVEDNSVIIKEQYIKNLTTTQEYLNGVYIVLAKDFFQSNNLVYPEISADNVKPVTGGTTLIDHYNWQQTSVSTNAVFSAWQYGYQVVRSCSFVIDKTLEFQAEDPARSKQIRAEAICLRALIHFTLVNMYAQSYSYSPGATHDGIPYVTSSDWTKQEQRVSTNEVYTNLIKELTEAQSLFTETGIKSLMMNKMAAKALLARIYLYMENWTKAKELAVEVATLVPLMTGSNYPGKLFTLQETEAIFQIAPAFPNINGSNYNTNYPGRYYNNKGSTVFLASADIATLLRQNPQDVRRNWLKSGGAGRDTVIKFPVDIIPGFSAIAGSYYPTLLRSSEMFLIAAEASAKLGEDFDARIYLDAIRKRADPTAVSSTAGSTALLDLIYNERRKELCFEGTRMFDIQRWKQPVKRSDPLTPAAAMLAYPNNKAIVPIPPVDVQKGIRQNPSY